MTSFAFTEDTTPTRVAYSVRGAGEPLLFVSGYALAQSALATVVAAFSERYRCITFDARGTGHTPSSTLPLTTASMARDALSVLDHLELDSAHVYGMSLGGMVAQELAIAAPDRVRTLVLASTSAGGWGARSADPWTMFSALSSAKGEIPGAGRASIRGAAYQAWAAGTHDAVSRLPQIQAPTMVIHGEQDLLVPLENAETLAALIPGARFEVLSGAGHLFPLEATETATRPVLDWLALQTDTQPSQPSDAVETAKLLDEICRTARSQLLPFVHTCHALVAKY